MSNLIIVESPTKVKTIKRYLSGDYEVVASMGHLRDLPKSKLAVDIEHNFEPMYVNIKEKENIIIVMVICMMENGVMIKKMELVNMY